VLRESRPIMLRGDGLVNSERVTETERRVACGVNSTTPWSQGKDRRGLDLVLGCPDRLEIEVRASGEKEVHLARLRYLKLR